MEEGGRLATATPISSATCSAAQAGRDPRIGQLFLRDRPREEETAPQDEDALGLFAGEIVLIHRFAGLRLPGLRGLAQGHEQRMANYRIELRPGQATRLCADSITEGQDYLAPMACARELCLGHRQVIMSQASVAPRARHRTERVRLHSRCFATTSRRSKSMLSMAISSGRRASQAQRALAPGHPQIPAARKASASRCFIPASVAIRICSSRR